MRAVLRQIFLAGLILGPAFAGAPAAAAPAGACLSAEERRAAIAGNKAVPAARAIRAAKAKYGGDVVRVQLCRSGKGLHYVLTVLARDGKVTRVNVDAASGRLTGGR